MNIPNFLSLSRIVLVNVHVFLMYFSLIDPKISVIVPFFIIVVTDRLDGVIARKFNMKTPIGDVLDVVGDRVVEMVYFVYFSSIGLIPFWIPAIFVSRGVLVDGLVGFVRSKGFTRLSFTNQGLMGFITTSNYGRAASAGAKLLTFTALSYGFMGGLYLAYLALAINLIRAVPILIQSHRFIDGI
ncbi:MAG: hypothetical protein GOU98_02770 [Candidatus Altiarchaeota archaeon]|nr:hypothetical protein [Candidatus Altiarchaeota archaeon]